MGAPARAQAQPSTDGPCNTARRTGAGVGSGRRVGKKLSGSLAKGFLYESGLRIAAELDATNNVVSTFVYGNKANVPEYMTKGGATYRVVTDHLGSVRLVVKTSDGTVAQRIDYDEFGIVTSDSNPGFQPFGFAGGLYDPDTKLVRFGARDYDASIGRWVSKDPVRFGGGQASLYVYAGGDPVTRSDPSGLLSYDDACKITSTCEEECARRAWEPLGYLSCLSGCVVGGLVWEKRQPYRGTHPDDEPDDDLLAGCQQHATSAQRECERLGFSQSACLNVYLIALRECLGRGKGY